jgi:predicted lipoprotein with Yx(FWY)xxD motif
MRPTHRWISLAALAATAVVAAACSSAAATPTATVEAAMSSPSEAMMATSSPAMMETASPTSLTIGVTNSSTLGDYLTGASGMTLYIFTADSPDVSSCSGTCATNWPPLTVAAGTTIVPPTGATASFGTINRSDGTTQVTYNRWPLYYYAGDSNAGDTTGQGVGGNWFVAPLSGSLPSAGASASSGY